MSNEIQKYTLTSSRSDQVFSAAYVDGSTLFTKGIFRMRRKRKKKEYRALMHACLPSTLDKVENTTFIKVPVRDRMGYMDTEAERRGSSKDVNSHDTSMLFGKMDVKDNHRLPPSLINNSSFEHLSDMILVERIIASFCCVYHQSKYQFLPFPELLASKQIFCDLLELNHSGGAFLFLSTGARTLCLGWETKALYASFFPMTLAACTAFIFCVHPGAGWNLRTVRTSSKE